MEREQVGTAAPGRNDGSRASPDSAEPSLGELLGRLTTDTGELVRQEVALLRAEMKQMGSTVAHDSAKVGVALEIANAGLLAVTAFIVIGLGSWFDNYWLSALIVGVVLLAVGGFMAKSAVSNIKQRGLMPDQTMNTLRQDTTWAKREAHNVQRELTK